MFNDIKEDLASIFGFSPSYNFFRYLHKSKLFIEAGIDYACKDVPKSA